MPARDAGIHVEPPEPLFRMSFMRRLVDRRGKPGDDEKRKRFRVPRPHIPAVSLSPLASRQGSGNLTGHPCVKPEGDETKNPIQPETHKL
jgi:hypothetical protein